MSVADAESFTPRLLAFAELVAAHDSKGASSLLRATALLPGNDVIVEASDALVQFASLESLYNSMSFLSMRSMRKPAAILDAYAKHRASLLEIGAEMEAIAGDKARRGDEDGVRSAGGEDGYEPSRMLHGLADVARLRIEMIQLYRAIATAKFPQPYAEALVSPSRGARVHPSVELLHRQAVCEAETLRCCMAAQVAIPRLDFTRSVVLMNGAQSNFDTWGAAMEEAVQRAKRHRPAQSDAASRPEPESGGGWFDFFSRKKEDTAPKEKNERPRPPAERWLELFVDTLTSKMTLYFSKLLPALAAQVTGASPLGLPQVDRSGGASDRGGGAGAGGDRMGEGGAGGSGSTSSGLGSAGGAGGAHSGGAPENARRKVDFVRLLDEFVRRCERDHSKVKIMVFLVVDSSRLDSPATSHPLLGFRVAKPTRGSDRRASEGTLGDALGDSDEGEEDAPMQGLRAYPAIFKYPATAADASGHWPSVVSLIMSLTASSKPGVLPTIHHLEPRAKSTYFLVPVEGAVTLCVIFGGLIKSDESIVHQFLRKMGDALRNTAIFAALSPS